MGLGNDGYAELVGKIKAIADVNHIPDGEKLSRIKAEIADHSATQAVRRAEFERKLEQMEKELATV
jgi:hypothetical protein